MKRSAVLTVALSAVLVLAAGCGSSASPTAWATVNGHTITQQEVQSRINLIKVLSPQAAAQLKQRTTWVNETQELVDEYLVQQQVAKAKFTLTAAQTSAAKSQLQSYLVSQSGSQAKLTAAIKAAGTSTAALGTFAVQATLLQSYLSKVVKTPTVTPAQISAFYSANASQFQVPEEYDLAHILVKTQALADSILKQLQNGASFSALAKQYSTDTASAKNGGDLGYAPLSKYVTPFANAAKQLTKVGQLSGVVHSQFGYHIIKLLGIQAATTQPLTAVSSQIQTYLQQQAQQKVQQAYLNALRKKAKISVNVPKTVP